MTTVRGGKLPPVFQEIAEEMKRQDGKWGEQNHPMLGKNLIDVKGRTCPSKDVLEAQLRNSRLRNGCKPNWFDILLEAICGAFLEEEPEKQREEMIQAAAVAAAVIEYLDRTIQKEALK